MGHPLSDEYTLNTPPAALAAGLLISPLDGDLVLYAGTAAAANGAAFWRYNRLDGWREENAQ
ncbi:MAG: hypothetical protein JRC77_10725 [Deltaproteobacteria bacterium]|nr:hypothetical protein [Deltaproteobacteria bacterium]